MTAIVCYPAAVLTEKTLPVDPTSAEALAVAGELMETLAATPEGLAIAAPQIGSSLDMLVYRDRRNGPTVLSNVSIWTRKGSQLGWEGCLSFPGKMFLVQRPRSVVVEAHDIVGDPVRLAFHDLYARMACHEYDHLQGRLVDTIAKEVRDR